MMGSSEIDPVAEAIEGLDQIAEGKTPAQLAAKVERNDFQRRLAEILKGLPELPPGDDPVVTVTVTSTVAKSVEEATEAAKKAYEAAIDAEEAAARARALADAEQDEVAEDEEQARDDVQAPAEPAH